MTITVNCSKCNSYATIETENTSIDFNEYLKKRGWHISSKMVLCPRCNAFSIKKLVENIMEGNMDDEDDFIEEPVEPEMEGGGGTWWMVCGACHGQIVDIDRYCRHCGRRIKQDGHGGADIKEHSEGHGEGDPGGRAGDTDDGRGETDC